MFAFHGYQRAIHQLIHGRPDPELFYVRGFNEQGTATTPFDMVVQNGMSRYHLCLEALARAPRVPAGGREVRALCQDVLSRHGGYTRAHLEGLPEVRDWTWTD